MAVQEGGAERGVVPIENSLEGGVAATLDALATDADRVRIAAEVVHPVHHCAVAGSPELVLEDARRVFSHPQATAQCQRFLRSRLPDAERIASPSTAEAVRHVAESSAPWVALGSRLSAELYGALVLEENVEDRPDNETRFVWLAPAGAVEPPPAGSRSKTSVVFWGRATSRRAGSCPSWPSSRSGRST